MNHQLQSWQDTTPQWQSIVKQAIASTQAPRYFASPDNTTSLGEIVQYAHEQRWGILPCGYGSKLDWGGLVRKVDLVLSTQNLNRVVAYAVADLTVTVEAGVKLSQIREILAKQGQFLPIDALSPETATMGGIVATADTGSWRQRYGGIRDLLLGISFVRADGKLAKAGGRVVKNVAGYDLMKLFTGSYGTLGVITELTFRVYPIPEASGTILLTGEPQLILKARNIILGSSLTPTAIDLLSNSLVNSLDRRFSSMGLVLRFQSIAASIQAQVAQVESISKSLELVSSYYQGDDENSLWEQLRKNIENIPPQPTITCKIVVEPKFAVEFLQNFRGVGRIHASSGIGMLQIKEDIEEINNVRSICNQKAGFLTILSSSSAIKEQIEPWGYNGNTLVIMRKIKEQFDPHNLLNSGRFFGDM